MSSTVNRFPQAPHSNVTVTAPVGAALGHACLTPPAGPDLGLDSLTMSGLVPDLFNSKPSLAGCAASWRACAVSPWVLKTITAGYTLQFARPPPSFGGVIQSVVQQGQSHFLQKEIDSLLQKEAISVVPPEEAASGFYSRYFLVPKKDGAIGQY